MNKPKIVESFSKKINLFVPEELLPEDYSIKRLIDIVNKFNVYDSIIALPDLHFKVKNFIPSGVVISLKNEFSYFLLGPNNDGIGGMIIKGQEKPSKDHIIKVFQKIKKRIALFRRESDVIDESTAFEILKNGIKNIIVDFGFSKKEILNFEEKGGYTINENIMKELFSYSLRGKYDKLPNFIPNTDILDRAKKTIGVLDGTSHFIELYKLGDIYDCNFINELGVEKNDLFFIVHAGGGDVSIVLHRLFFRENKSYGIDTDIGKLALESLKIAANFGFGNRLYIYKEIKHVVERIFGKKEKIEIFFDAPHDFLEIEEESIFFHRKGAVKLIPKKKWKEGNFGKLYILPTYPGGKAYLIWKERENKFSKNYMSHGAGRKIKKDKAINNFSSQSTEELIRKNVLLFRYGFDQIEGQHPLSFKDEQVIVDTIKNYELANIAAELIPLASLKT